MIRCQNCGATIPDHYTYKELGEGKEFVAHTMNRPDELGVRTDYYCDPGCFVADHE